MEDFYRDNRRRIGLLMDGAEPVGGRWNFDAENREPPPKGGRTLGLPEPDVAGRGRHRRGGARGPGPARGRGVSSSSATTVRGCSR